MRLRDKPATRGVIEEVLRGVSVSALALLIAQAVHALHADPVASARGSEIHRALVAWSTRESPRRAHVAFDSAPPPVIRDWIAASAAAGTAISWEGATFQPTAVAVEPIADPTHPSRVWVASPPGTVVRVRDDIGDVGRVMTRGAGAAFVVPGLSGTVRATTGTTTATGVQDDSLSIKPVLVLAMAGWEGKFILAALEEYGWQVDARLTVSPKAAGVVIQDAPTVSLDTAHYGAVIAVDSSAGTYADRIAAFVRQGGGFIATGDAAALRVFAPLMPGATSAPLPESSLITDTSQSDPRRLLAVMPLVELKADAVPVEARDPAVHDAVRQPRVTVAARRAGAGRVVQVGYVDTWRWRMEGVDSDPVHAYRRWWSALVSSVIYAPRSYLAVKASVEPTPLATMIATLGAPHAEAVPRTTLFDDRRLPAVLFAVVAVAFIIEWTSRRTRGEP